MFKRKTKHYPRSERKEGILLVLRLVRKRGGITAREMAFWLNMRPSTHFRGILSEMVDSGLVGFKEMPHRPNVIKRVYTLTELGKFAAEAALESTTAPDVIDF